MDSLKPTKATHVTKVARTTTSAVARQTDGFSRPRVALPKENKFAPESSVDQKRPVVQHERAVVGRRKNNIWSALLAIFAVTLCVGFVYSRAEIIISPAHRAIDIGETIRVSTTPRAGMVHGVWLAAGSDTKPQSLYPHYILVNNLPPVDGQYLAVSRVDVIRVLRDKIEREYAEDLFRVGDISIDAEKMIVDSISDGDTIAQEVRISGVFQLTMVAIIDTEKIRKDCQYKQIIPNTNSLDTCLEGFSGIARGKVIVHPWFAVRTPIARAITIVVE